MPVDPYGWDVPGMRDPYDTFQGTNGINVLLWKDPRLNAQGAIDQRPLARFTMTASAGQTANENTTLNLTVPSGGAVQVTLSPSRSSDSDGNIQIYRWYINGTLQSQSQPQTSTFSRSLSVGIYQIFLVIQDDKGATGAVGASIVVTAGSAPTASTGAAMSVTANSATLNGTVNPNGLSTTVYFQWGTTTAYGNTTPSQSVGSGTSSIPISANLNGLSPNTTYHHRLVGSNNVGTAFGSDGSFTTAPVQNKIPVALFTMTSGSQSA